MKTRIAVAAAALLLMGMNRQPAPIPTPVPTVVPTPIPTVVPTPTPEPVSAYWFPNSDFWQREIGDAPQVNPNSAEQMDTLADALRIKGYANQLDVFYDRWTMPIHRSPEPLRWVTVTQANTGEAFHPSVDPDGSGAVSVPFGYAWMTPDPREDGHISVVTPTDVWEASRYNAATHTATTISRYPRNGAGYGSNPMQGPFWWKQGSTGPGVCMTAGLVTLDEIKAGRIDHKLAISLPANARRRALMHEGKEVDREVIYPPGVRSDGKYDGPRFVLEGSVLQLRPDYPEEGLSVGGLAVVRALKKFGAVDRDNSGSFGIAFEGLYDGQWLPYAAIVRDLRQIRVEDFRVLVPDGIAIRYMAE